jgi:hypothetical protein
MVPFAVQASRGCSTPSHLALALAAEFATVRATRADRALDALAAWLVGACDDEPVGQLRALTELAGSHLEAVILSSAIDDLLLDRVVAGGAGHPLLLAIACSEAGRRAGLSVGIVAGADGAFVAHHELAERVGQVCWALRAAELRLALPFEARTRERLEADLRRVRARLN